MKCFELSTSKLKINNIDKDMLKNLNKRKEVSNKTIGVEKILSL